LTNDYVIVMRQLWAKCCYF